MPLLELQNSMPAVHMLDIPATRHKECTERMRRFVGLKAHLDGAGMPVKDVDPGRALTNFHALSHRFAAQEVGEHVEMRRALQQQLLA